MDRLIFNAVRVEVLQRVPRGTRILVGGGVQRAVVSGRACPGCVRRRGAGRDEPSPDPDAATDVGGFVAGPPMRAPGATVASAAGGP
jgi:hypothetical protein